MTNDFTIILRDMAKQLIEKKILKEKGASFGGVNHKTLVEKA